MNETKQNKMEPNILLHVWFQKKDINLFIICLSRPIFEMLSFIQWEHWHELLKPTEKENKSKIITKRKARMNTRVKLRIILNSCEALMWPQQVRFSGS